MWGSLNLNSPCMIDGKCDKDFPKDFSNETIVEDIDGYPKYHRQSPQDGGGQFMKTRPNQTNWCEMDNRNVIPYNAFLLKTLNCHINVEYCSSINSIQYLSTRVMIRQLCKLFKTNRTMMRYSAFSTPDRSAVWKPHGEFSTLTYVQLNQVYFN